jgi:hypothetical protein
MMAIFALTLHPTYFDQGFFNVKVSHDRFVRKTEGPLRIRLGRNGVEIEARLDRHTNPNGTARILGGVQLRYWFHSNFNPMDTVAVDLSLEDLIILDRMTPKGGRT